MNQRGNTITVRFYATLKDKLGETKVTVVASSVAEALEGLKKKFGPKFTEALYRDGKMNDRYLILLRGQRVFRDDLEKVDLAAGDVLDIFPPVAGG